MRRSVQKIMLLSLALILCIVNANSIAFAAESIAGIDVSDAYAKILVTGSMPTDMSVRISGVEAETVYHPLMDAEIEVRTLFLIDITNSLSYTNRNNVISILDAAIENKDAEELFAFATFGTGYNQIMSFTDDRFDLIRTLEQIAWQDNGYSMDVVPAISMALQQVLSDAQDHFRFNQIIIFSDSRTGSVSGITREELLFMLNDANIPIHTVGFRYRSNVEELNDFYAFSRITGGVSYEFTPDSNVNEIASRLSRFAHDTHYLQVSLPQQFRDGTIRPLELFDRAGVLILTHNLRMPLDNDSPAAEQEMLAPTQEAVQAPSLVDEPSLDEETSFLRNRWLLILVVAVGAVVSVAGIVVFIVLAKPKQLPEPPAKPEPTPDLEDTMPIDYDEYSTKPLIGEGLKPLAEQSIYLVINDITQPHKRYEVVVEDTVEIGRKPNKPGIAIDYDPKISRRHCAVKNRNGVLWVEDLGAVNKTYVNDARLNSAQVIKDNDVLVLGNTRFFVRIEKR